MNIFRKYTLRNLKENKTRTLITIIGIILSVSMFTATIESFVTVQNLLLEYTENTVGSYHVSFHGINGAEADRITADKKVTAFTATEDIGYAEIGSFNEAKPYIFITGVPKDYTEVSAIRIVSGRLPENDRELIISDHILTNGGVSIQLGDTLTLEIGQRQWADAVNSPDDENDSSDSIRQILNQDTTYKNESETLINTQEITYTVVGFCQRPDHDLEPYTAPGYTAFTLSEGNSNKTGALFCTLEKPSDYKDFMESYKDTGTVKKNTNLLMFSLVLHDNAFEGLFIGLGAVLIFIIVFGSIALIFNSFSISLSERTKQYGLLKSVGATKKQIMKSVLFEAFSLCVIAVPFGLIAGCAGIAVTFRALGGIITGLLSQFEGLSMKLIISPTALISASVISILTILLSAYIPAKRAVKISPVEAIRQNNDIKINKKNIKISPLTKKLFGLSGILSSKNFKRNRKKYSVTVFSLFVSVVMFISASSLASYFTAAIEMQAQDMNYDIVMLEDSFGDLTDEDKENFIKAANSVSSADSVAINRSTDKVLTVNTDAVSADYLRYYDFRSDEENLEQTSGNISVCFISDEIFKEQLKKSGLREEDYFNKNAPRALLYDNIRLITMEDDGKQYLHAFPFFNEKAVPATIKATENMQFPGFFIEKIYEENGTTYYQYRKGGDEGEDLTKNETKILTETEAVKNHSIEIGAVLSEKPFFLSHMTSIIYPESMMGYTSFNDSSFSLEAFFLAKNYNETEKQLRTSIHQLRLADKVSCVNYAAEVETIRGIVVIAKVLAYGFIVLISLIAAANVFNTISTNIALRRREFATLRSVGLTKKGLYKMEMYESLLYGLKSLIFSLPVSTVITLVIYFIVHESGYDIDFYIPIGSYIIAILSVFIIVFISMFYSVNKIKKTNIIDSLRSENT